MRDTTLCYIERDDMYLMLHRTKKKNDENRDMWIGVGGHIEEDESPEDCLLREIREETGLTLTAWRFRGVVTFVTDGGEGQQMFLFTADGFEGALRECDEGELRWVRKADVGALPLWAGDHIFLKLLAEDAKPFLLKLVYRGSALVRAVLDGRVLLNIE